MGINLDSEEHRDQAAEQCFSTPLQLAGTYHIHYVHTPAEASANTSGFSLQNSKYIKFLYATTTLKIVFYGSKMSSLQLKER